MATVSEATARKPRRKLNPGFDRFSGLYLWALFIIVFGIWVPDQFLTPRRCTASPPSRPSPASWRSPS